MSYPEAAWEPAILEFSPRSLQRYEKYGYVGHVDKRRHSPPCGGSRRRRSRGCCAPIRSNIAASMFGTFIR